MSHDPAAHPALAERYVLGELTEAERADFEVHYFECPTCAEDVLAASAFVDGARAILAGAGRPAPGPSVAAPARRRRLPASLRGFAVRAAALAALPLIALAAHQRFGVIPELRQEIAGLESPRTVSPFVLRPLTRGEGRLIALGPHDRTLTLALELPPDQPDASTLRGELRDGAGHAVLAPFDLAPPGAGEPLLIQLPVARLAPGRYHLVISVPTMEQTTGRTFEQVAYPFALTRP